MLNEIYTCTALEKVYNSQISFTRPKTNFHRGLSSFVTNFHSYTWTYSPSKFLLTAHGKKMKLFLVLVDVLLGFKATECLSLNVSDEAKREKSISYIF